MLEPNYPGHSAGALARIALPINSILVKFDLYDVQTGSPGANLTGFYSGGTYPQAPNNPQYDMSGSGINMESGDLCLHARL